MLSACERSHAIRLRNSTRLQAGTRPAREGQRGNAPAGHETNRKVVSCTILNPCIFSLDLAV